MPTPREPQVPNEPPAKPVKRAVALRYDAGEDQAPTVIASGQGLVAEKIIETARLAGVAVQENAELTAALAQVELGTTIPEELYPVVAEVLVFVSRMNRQRGRGAANGPGSPGVTARGFQATPERGPS